MLRYDAPSPITEKEFMDACESSLSRHDYQLVQAALEGEASNHPFLKKYGTFQDMVRRSLSAERARALGLPADQYRDDGEKSYVVDAAVRKAVADQNVLDGEMILIALEWGWLDEASGQHVFDIVGLLSYALKLSIITRKNLFTRDAGDAEFKRLFSSLAAQIKSR